MKGLRQVHVHAAGARERRRKLRAHQRADERENAGEEPDEQYAADRVNLGRDFRRLTENRRADDRSDNHGRRMRKSNRTPEPRSFTRHSSLVTRYGFSLARTGFSFGLKFSLPTSTSAGFASPSISKLNRITT